MKQFPKEYSWIKDTIPTTTYIPQLGKPRLPGISWDMVKTLEAGEQITDQLEDILKKTIRYPETAFGYKLGFPLQSLLLQNITCQSPGALLKDIPNPSKTYTLQKSVGRMFNNPRGREITILEKPSNKELSFILGRDKNGWVVNIDGSMYNEFSAAGSLAKHIPKLISDTENDSKLDEIDNEEIARQIVIALFHDLGEMFTTDIPGPLKKKNNVLSLVEKNALKIFIERIQGLHKEQKISLWNTLQKYEKNKTTDRFKRTEYQSLGDEISTFHQDIVANKYNYAEGHSIIIDMLHAVSQKFKDPESTVSYGDGSTKSMQEVQSIYTYVCKKVKDRENDFSFAKKNIDLNNLPEMLVYRFQNRQEVEKCMTTTEKNLAQIKNDLANLTTL